MDILSILDTSLEVCNDLPVQFGAVTIAGAGVFTDTLSGNPCDTIRTITVTRIPEYQLELDTTLCADRNIVIGGVLYDQIGNFTDTLPGANGCDTFLILHILAPNTFSPFLPRDTVLCGLSGFTLTSPYPNTQWGTLGNGPQIFIKNPDTIYYTVTDSLGCTFNDTIQISTCCGNTEIYVPNAIKPSSIENFGFKPFVSGNCKLSRIEVYDRWGALVFRSQSADDQWLGLSARGEKLNPAVFTYLLYLTDSVTGKNSVIAGDVTLIR
jgi:CHU_C Type IX secretion signal domain